MSTRLAALMSMLRAGETVVIWRLDRLGRSLKNLIELVERLDAAKAGLPAAHGRTAEAARSGQARAGP
ncbi:DNA invertase Pin-like site-specific DNA recombinase [Actimicrobium sp. GrIS 1.19]|uniref:recombinase family protein n=1 Tax=Actimicrobium sp. GrIS 1.19 TaxID=3071708 RepID=UPI002DFE6D05|nr:DNA invertase Pin-like site-specific DNA recombinase [Actimicrobium sp. GrIS 1.19]